MIKYSYFKSEIGIIKIGVSGGAVCEIGIADCLGESAPSALADRAFKEISEYLNGKRKAFDFPIAPKGSDFQKKVWSALREIPYGKTKTYGEIAADIGSSKAARAVGNACNKNPLLLAIPCHRVLGANGSLTGFAAGIEIKKHLLLLEKKCDF